MAMYRDTKSIRQYCTPLLGETSTDTHRSRWVCASTLCTHSEWLPARQGIVILSEFYFSIIYVAHLPWFLFIPIDLFLFSSCCSSSHSATPLLSSPQANYRGETALHLAALHRNSLVSEYLLANISQNCNLDEHMRTIQVRLYFWMSPKTILFIFLFFYCSIFIFYYLFIYYYFFIYFLLILYFCYY